MAASDLPLQRSGRGFDIYLHTEVRDDLAFLLGSEVAAEQRFFGDVCAASGTRAAFVLDFLNPPALASCEMSLGHVLLHLENPPQCSMGRVY